MAFKHNMTSGNIVGHMTGFAVPLVLGNLFQLTYNAADAIIVGRFVGDEAQAAIGIANPLMNVLIFFIVGCCSGIGVILSECCGAGDKENFRQELGTAVSFGILFFAGTGIVFWLCTEGLLGLISTPPEIMGQTAGYLRIVLTGLVFSFLYNVFAAAARSTGNAKVPLYFLVLSTVLNILLDYFLIAVLGMGVYGAALGTVISQGAASLLLVVYAGSTLPLLRLDKSCLAIRRERLRKILNYSFSTGMQKITLNVGKVLIQSFVNPLGIQVVAAFNAVNRIDDFVFQPEQSIAAALTTFSAQNRGAGKKERIKKGFWYGLWMETVYWAAAAILIFTQAELLMQLFTVREGSSMVQAGTVYLRYMSFFYLLPAVTNWMQGYIRGFGRMNVCLAATFIQMAGRVGAGAVLIPAYGLEGVAFSCLAGWICMLLFELPYYFLDKKKYGW